MNDPLPAGEIAPAAPARIRIPQKLQDWIRTVLRDPSAEERAITERRARLLDELNRAVSDAPDDMPLRDVIERINHPYGD